MGMGVTPTRHVTKHIHPERSLGVERLCLSVDKNL
jgi:hypothetical protein